MLNNRFVKLIAFLVILAILSGCGGNPATQSAPNEPNQDVQVTETSNEVVTFDETIHINNCGGKAESKQVAQRSFSTNIEGAAQLKVGYEIVEGSVTAKYGQYRNISKSHELAAPAGTDMEFVLRWTEQTWIGSIIANGSSGTYNVHVPISVEQVSSQDLGCGGSAPVVPNNPPTATPIPTVAVIPLTDTPSNSELSIRQSWSTNGVVLTLESAALGKDNSWWHEFTFTLENRTGGEIFFNANDAIIEMLDQSYTIRDEMHSYREFLPDKLANNESARFVVGFNTLYEYDPLSTSEPYIYIRVSNLSRITDALWKIDVPH